MQRLRYICLLFFLLADLSFSFYQQYHTPLYGDLADIVVPTPDKGYYKVLHDPFGLNVLIRDEVYPNPNRFFAHWSVSTYFLNMPLLLQKFTGPIDSVYLSSALAKIMIQILIIYVLAVYISNTFRVFKPELLIAAALVTPLFQTAGFVRSMGIIDPSVVYAFFYALPLGLLLLVMLPFFRRIFYAASMKANLPLILLLILSLSIVFLSLNGPLVPGVVLIICSLVALHLWIRNFKSLHAGTSLLRRLAASFRMIPAPLFLFMAWSCALGLYSLYLGRNNELNSGDALPVLERYAKLPLGLWKLLIRKIGIPLLLLGIASNAILISTRYKSAEGQKILKLLRWIGIFSLVYILLLPLGGFRAYRENIIRYDTILPVTLGLVLIFGMTSFYLLNKTTGRIKGIYLTGLVVVLAIFTNADRLNTHPYECERQAMESLSRSQGPVAYLESDCPLMNWRKSDDCEQNVLIARLLDYYKITNGIQTFCYQDP